MKIIPPTIWQKILCKLFLRKKSYHFSIICYLDDDEKMTSEITNRFVCKDSIIVKAHTKVGAYKKLIKHVKENHSDISEHIYII